MTKAQLGILNKYSNVFGRQTLICAVWLHPSVVSREND